MISNRVFFKNLLANWTGLGANLVVMFFLSPFILHSIGITEYGIWQLLIVLTGYMGIMDLGIRASTGRYIILYLAKNDINKVDETIRTGLGIYSVLSGFILGAGFLLGIFFPEIFEGIPKTYHRLIAVLFPVFAVNLWVSALRTVLSSLLAAYERFDLSNGSELIVLFLRTIITIIVLKMGLSLIGLTIAVIASNMAGLVVNIILCRKIHENLRIWPLLLKKERVKELYNYGIGAFLLAVSAKVIGQTDLVVAGAFIDVNSVAVYSVGAMLIYYSDSFTKKINRTLFPSLQKAVATQAFKEVKFIMYRQTRIYLSVGILLYVGYFSFCQDFIKLWMYDPKTFSMESVYKASVVMQILAFAKLILLPGSFSRSILSATDKIKFAANMIIVEAFINLGLSLVFVLVLGLGLKGIALGTLVSNLTIQVFVLPFHAFKKVNISWVEFLLKMGTRGFFSTIIFFGICFFVQKLFIIQSWYGFFVQVGFSVLLYIPLVFIFLLHEKDKKRILQTLRKKFLAI